MACKNCSLPEPREAFTCPCGISRCENCARNFELALRRCSECASVEIEKREIETTALRGAAEKAIAALEEIDGIDIASLCDPTALDQALGLAQHKALYAGCILRVGLDPQGGGKSVGLRKKV